MSNQYIDIDKLAEEIIRGIVDSQEQGSSSSLVTIETIKSILTSHLDCEPVLVDYIYRDSFRGVNLQGFVTYENFKEISIRHKQTKSKDKIISYTYLYQSPQPNSKGIDIEALANIEHERWSGWQLYLHSKCSKNEDGSLTIPKELVNHWTKQINTKYADLPEHSKEADRVEARKVLPFISINSKVDASVVEELEKIRCLNVDAINGEIEAIKVTEAIDKLLTKLGGEK